MGHGEGGPASADGASTIHLPSHLKPTDEPYSCRVQGCMVVVGCTSGQVLFFGFAEKS